MQLDIGLGEPKTSDADILFLLSDGYNAVGFVVPDGRESTAICYGIDGPESGPYGITAGRSDLNQINHNRRRRTSRPRRENVNYVSLLFKTSKDWGTCVTPHDDGFVNPAGFSRSISPYYGIYLDVYLDDEEEIHNLLHIHSHVVVKNNIIKKY